MRLPLFSNSAHSCYRDHLPRAISSITILCLAIGILQPIASGQEKQPADVGRFLTLRLNQDFSLRMFITSSTSARSVSQPVTQHLRKKIEAVLPELYETCELDQNQINKQNYASDATVRSIERAIKNWEKQYGSESVAPREAGQAHAELIDLNRRIENCLWDPKGLFQMILQGQLTSKQKKAYQNFLKKRNDKLPQFLRAISRSAVLRKEKSEAIATILKKRMGELAERTLSECANVFLEVVESDELADLLDERELAASKRISNYFIENAK